MSLGEPKSSIYNVASSAFCAGQEGLSRPSWFAPPVPAPRVAGASSVTATVLDELRKPTKDSPARSLYKFLGGLH